MTDDQIQEYLNTLRRLTGKGTKPQEEIRRYDISPSPTKDQQFVNELQKGFNKDENI